MTGKHTIFDTRRKSKADSRDVSPAPDRTDESSFKAHPNPLPEAEPAPLQLGVTSNAAKR